MNSPELYDEVNGQGEVVRRGFALGSSSVRPPGHRWVPHVPTPPSLAELRRRKLREIDHDFGMAAEALLQGYPPAERLTWPTQQAEALAWAASNSTPTPYLDGLAAARGITAEDMRARTLEAVQAWMTASQLLVGRRQALRDAANIAPDQDALALIRWQE